jgi:hypothetical protein
MAFADAMVDEWDSWIKEATAAGVLTGPTSHGRR